MFKISYTVNGRSVAPNHFADELGKEITRSATIMAQQRIASIRCPIHHQTARILPGALGSRFQLQGCCEQIMAEIHRRFRQT